MMVSGGITKYFLSSNAVVPCAVCSFRVKANSVLCAQCCKLIHGRCAGVKKVMAKCLRNLACGK